MKKYRVREGSIMDWLRMIIVSAAFWAVIGIVTISAYPM